MDPGLHPLLPRLLPSSQSRRGSKLRAHALTERGPEGRSLALSSTTRLSVDRPGPGQGLTAMVADLVTRTEVGPSHAA